MYRFWTMWSLFYTAMCVYNCQHKYLWGQRWDFLVVHIYLLNTVYGLFNICILYKYIIYSSFSKEININILICVVIEFFGRKYILIIGSKQYIVIDESDAKVIKWMRI